MKLKRIYEHKEPDCNTDAREKSRLISLCQAIVARPKDTKTWVQLTRNLNKQGGFSPVTMEWLYEAWDILEDEMEGVISLPDMLQLCYELMKQPSYAANTVGYTLRIEAMNKIYDKFRDKTISDAEKLAMYEDENKFKRR